MSTMQEELGKKVREHRKSYSYTTPEFAEKLGVSVGLINNIENARNDVFKLNLLTRITKELNICISELLKLNEIDITSIDFYKNSEFKLKHADLDIYDSESIEIINFYLTQIVKTFISTIVTNKYDKKKIKILGEYLKHDLQTIIELNNKD